MNTARARANAVTLRNMASVVSHPVVGPMTVKAAPATLNGVADDLEEDAATSLREQVRAFHVAMNVPADATRPTVILDDRVRLRCALIAEEFFETLQSMIVFDAALVRAKEIVLDACAHHRVSVDMAELADGMADLDYVVEGTRLEMGIDGGPIAAEVHRANMSKVGGPVAANGKRLKPPGWTPPDIAGELRRQGFEG